MPFRSEKQRRYMYAQHPDIAKRWSREYGDEPQPKGKRKRRVRVKRKGYTKHE